MIVLPRYISAACNWFFWAMVAENLRKVFRKVHVHSTYINRVYFFGKETGIQYSILILWSTFDLDLTKLIMLTLKAIIFIIIVYLHLNIHIATK